MIFPQLLVVCEKVRIAPDAWYNVVNCTDDLKLAASHIPPCGLVKLSFDEILDLTADVFLFLIIYCASIYE